MINAIYVKFQVYLSEPKSIETFFNPFVSNLLTHFLLPHCHTHRTTQSRRDRFNS